MTVRRGDPPDDTGSNPQNPLVAPFRFLSKESESCPACVLRFTDIAARGFADGLVLPKGERVDGLLKMTMPGLSVAKQPTKWEICVEEDGDSFSPKTISWVVAGAGVKYVYKLLNYTNLGTYQFPTRIETTGSSYPPSSPPSLLVTGLTTVVSVRMPAQVADYAFRLDEGLPAAIWDVDQGKFTRSAPRSEACTRKLRLADAADQQASTNAEPATTPTPSLHSTPR